LQLAPDRILQPRVIAAYVVDATDTIDDQRRRERTRLIEALIHDQRIARLRLRENRVTRDTNDVERSLPLIASDLNPFTNRIPSSEQLARERFADDGDARTIG
jgi:hypothetical protein